MPGPRHAPWFAGYIVALMTPPLATATSRTAAGLEVHVEATIRQNKNAITSPDHIHSVHEAAERVRTLLAQYPGKRPALMVAFMGAAWIY